MCWSVDSNLINVVKFHDHLSIPIELHDQLEKNGGGGLLPAPSHGDSPNTYLTALFLNDYLIGRHHFGVSVMLNICISLLLVVCDNELLIHFILFYKFNVNF